MEISMYSRILIATDGSELANRGLAHGLALAKALGAGVIVVTASEPWVPIGADATGAAVGDYGFGSEYEKAEEKAGQAILKDAAAAADKIGVVAATLFVSRQYPATAIIDTAEAQQADLIVMASHGRRGVERLLLGSQASEVLTRSRVPVLIVK
jgi:nucleotide-binding universal stress UspA family protein